jgi:acyl-[acyl-carrier-protein]-phospholipid O-acyltransferase/long-chain-fatty-acid--[acyl-carrier-protein] ligase
VAANVSFGERCLRLLGVLLVRLVYRVRVYSADQLPEGGFLLLPNHLTWVDALVLQVASPRPVRFVVLEGFYSHWLLHPILSSAGCIPISPQRAKEALRRASDAIERGEVVCIFPEGELSRTGILLRLKRGYELVARAAQCPVVPVWMDQLWGSVFSFSGGRFFFKWPRQWPYPVTVAFGAPLSAPEADIALVRERFLELGEFCFQKRPLLRGHLGRACIDGLRRRQFSTAVVDGMDGGELSRGSLLAAALALSRSIDRECPRYRVGIVLPPGRAGMVANLAVVLAGRVPVNLNFTAGRSALDAALRIAELKCCITARSFARRFPDFPWPEHCLYLEEMLAELKPAVVGWRLGVALLPAWLLARLIGLPREGDRQEAVLLFTSGSSGEPKGVVLSHRNLLGNVSQFAAMLNLGGGDALMACLPFFHSFGCTVTLWYPLIEGVRAVTFPSALEIGRCAQLIQRHGVTLLCSTPTFIRGYLRKADPAQLASLELVVTGAERLPNELGNAFRERFGKEVLQGYGLTETSPVASVNLPEPNPRSREELSVQPSNRQGSVGKLAPGMAAQIRDPDTGANLSLHDTGMLWLRGPNIFEGYLNEPARTAEVLREGWFKTGDLARFDEDGFLFIEGRMSRFSKIGGEMVPHESIETRVIEALGLPQEERCIAIAGVPDEAKGEALVLLTTREVVQADLREKLSAVGLPNLWIPRKIVRVLTLPLLASGKLDLRECRELALQAVKSAE